MRVPDVRHLAVALAMTGLGHLAPLVREPSTTHAGTVYTDVNVDVRGIEFNNENTYAVAGVGTLTIASDREYDHVE